MILNLYDLKNIEIPCSLLENLESLSFQNVQNIQLFSLKSHISLDKLKHLYMDNISFEENKNLKIQINNLKYLDLKVKEVDGGDDNEEIDNKEEEEEDNNSEYINRKGFIEKNDFEYLIQIFNINFLS